MNDEIDPLRSVLREWEAPEPSASLDARVRDGFRSTRSPWGRFWSARVSVPVPILAAAAVVLLIAGLVAMRPARPAPSPLGVMTRLDATGFLPLPDGAARVEDVPQ